MIKWTILISGVLIFGTSQIYGQQGSDQIKWFPTGKFAGFGGNHFQTITVDDQSVTYHKIEAGMKLKASDLIKSSHTFDPIKTFSLMPEGKGKQAATSQLAIVTQGNGKMLAVDISSGFEKGLLAQKMSYKVLDEDLKLIKESVPLKYPEGNYLPVNMVDMSNPLSNKPFQLFEDEDGIIMGYVSSGSAEGNLHIGLAKFDSDYNLVSNQLHEIDLPAHRLLDFRLGEKEIDGSYYVIIKETLEKKPATKIQMTGPSSMLDNTRTSTNEQKHGKNRLYELRASGQGNRFEIEGELPTPALRILDNGSVLIAGLKNNGEARGYTTAYSIRLDSKLKEVSKSEQSLAEIHSTETKAIRVNDKGSANSARHIKIHELGDNLLLSVEMFGSITQEVNSGGQRSYNYSLLVGDNLLVQMDKDGGFTGLNTSISKDQLEYGGAQFYSGSYLYVKDDELRFLFNDHKDNLSSAKKERWTNMDYKKGDSVLREMKFDSNLKTISDGVVSSGKKPVVMIVPNAHFANGNLVLYGTDFDSYYGAVVN